MPFNAQSYYRNKAKRKALKYLADARAMKARLIAGEPNVLDNLERVSTYAELARLHWKSYLSYAKLDECDADMKLLQAGKITYAEFMAKHAPGLHEQKEGRIRHVNAPKKGE